MQTTIDSFLHCICSKCGTDLRWVETQPAEAEEASAACLVDHAIDVGWVAVGDSVVYAPAFFRGLASLILALHGRSKWAGFDMSPLAQRRVLLSRACALLTDWPERFIQHCFDNKWTAVDLALSRKQLPFWLDHVVKQHIDHRSSPISPGEALTIYEQSASKTGQFSLKAARSLSGRMIEAKHLPSPWQPAVSDDTFEVLLAHIDHLIAKQLKPLERCHLLADKVMLVLAKVCGLSQAEVARYSLAEARAFASEEPPDFWTVPTTVEGVAAWMGWYLRDVRPKLGIPVEVASAFVSRRNNFAMTESAFAERFRRHVRNACLHREIRGFGALSWRPSYLSNA